MGRIGVRIDGIRYDHGIGKPGHRVNVFLAHAHVNDGGPSVLIVHQPGREGRGILKPKCPGCFRHGHPKVLFIMLPHNPGYKYPVPSKGDCKVIPVIIGHAAGFPELSNTLGRAHAL